MDRGTPRRGRRSAIAASASRSTARARAIRTWLAPHALADRLVTNGEWRAFIADGGYHDRGHWLSDGWAWVQRERYRGAALLAPGRRRRLGRPFGLDGVRRSTRRRPVKHISFYEADAFARWAGARLPTEAEWESAAERLADTAGNLLDTGGSRQSRAAAGERAFARCSATSGNGRGRLLAYPGFRPAPGAVGEYNGKFMSGQFVLRGGSCATPRGHARASYRNFFYPHQRWQFTGLRLAKDI